MTNSFADFAKAKMIFVIGSNMTEAHPVAATFVKHAVLAGAQLFVADPRRTALADMAELHIPIRVGSDVAFLNGLMNVLITEDLYDKAYVESRCSGFEELKAKVLEYPPERAAEISGVSADMIRDVARRLASVKPVMLMYTLGITEHTCGVNNVLSCANLQMLLGNVGFECGGVNPLRGQNNVQGACDMGALPNVFPGYQRVDNAGGAGQVREGLERDVAAGQAGHDDSPDARGPAERQDQGILHLRRKPGQHGTGHPARGALPGIGRVHRLPGYLPDGDDAVRPRDLPGGRLE